MPARLQLYVSNTVGDDPRHRVKSIALLVEATDDLVIAGEGARLVLHGLQTTFAVIDSRRVRVEGLEFDVAVPTVVDATVVGAGVAAGRAYRLIRVPAATLFSVEGASIRWHGEVLDSGAVAWSGRDALEYTQIHDPASQRTWRGPNPLFEHVRSIRLVGERDIRIDYEHAEEPADLGLVYSMRSTTRDHPHAETAGFPQFSPGDQIEVVDRVTLQAIASATVRSARQPSGRAHEQPLRTIVVTVDSELPDGLAGWTAVENVTRTPTVRIVRNIFRNVPTRGVLVTTRRAVLIEENRFERTGMAGIYVSCDADEWWESGPVRDLTIRGNEFIEPGGPAIFLDPRNTRCDPGRPVHSGVIVTENRFVLDGVPALDARSTRGIRFRNNNIVRRGPDRPDIMLRSCSDVCIELDGDGPPTGRSDGHLRRMSMPP